jgi:hypothetical protein
MTRLIDLDLRPTPATLRQFGWVALGAFGLLALLAYAEAGPFRFGLGSAREPTSAAFAALGLLSASASLVRPELNRPLFVALSVAFFPVGLVVSHLLLAVIFYLVVGPVALLVRALVADPMRRRFDRQAESYWTDVPARDADASYFRQF